MDNLDALLHQPLRTQIAAFLAGSGEATFSELRRELDVSDGNLESHLKKLIAADYVAVRKESGAGRPQSYYTLTATGLDALRAYVAALQRVLAFGAAKPAAPPLEAMQLKPAG
ncbi:MAG: transcriptional regulator [Sulfuricella sp.]|nr:transcriptional regulator [Sulfuricella sp.]